MKKTATLWALLVAGSHYCPAQNTAARADQQLQNKYWSYRNVLRKHFTWIGKEFKGQSHPATSLSLNTACGPHEHFKNRMDWGDGTEHMGKYLMLLATEYEVLRRQQADTRATLNELYYALHRLDQLDYQAEKMRFPKKDSSTYQGELDGRLYRDDVPVDFYRNFQEHGHGKTSIQRGESGIYLHNKGMSTISKSTFKNLGTALHIYNPNIINNSLFISQADFSDCNAAVYLHGMMSSGHLEDIDITNCQLGIWSAALLGRTEIKNFNVSASNYAGFWNYNTNSYLFNLGKILLREGFVEKSEKGVYQQYGDLGLRCVQFEANKLA